MDSKPMHPAFPISRRETFAHKPVVPTLFEYLPSGVVTERSSAKVEDLLTFHETEGLAWLNVDGIHSTEMIEAIGKYVGIHPIVLEDIITPDQRPKIEYFDDYLYLVVRMFYWDAKSQAIEAEQVSIVLSGSFLITFQEGDPEGNRDVFGPIRQRIREGRGRLIRSGLDFLAYSLVDAIVDQYFFLLENMGEEIEDLETELIASPQHSTLRRIHKLKQQLIYLRRSVWPLREVIARVERGESDLFTRDTLIYMRDLYDHTIQVMDTIESYRDIVSGMLDIYLSSLSNRMNEIMKVLTIISTVFIPLTFIAGVYGMNFDYMPELGWRPSYFIVLGGMAAIVVGMIVYFRKRKWL